MFTYDIGGKKYTQQKLVLGQVQELLKFFKGKTIPATLSPFNVIETLGDDLCEGIAIVLREEGRHLKDKDIEKLALEIRFSIEPEIAFEVIKDFFACNPIAPMFEGLAGQIKEIADQMAMGLPIGLKKPSPSSAEETSPAETKSSGDTRPENASPSSGTE